MKVFSNFFSTTTTHLRIVYPCGLPCNWGISSVIPLDFSCIVPHIGRFVKGFLKISFKKVACRKVGSYTASANSSTPSVGFPTPEVFPPLDTNNIPHLPTECNRQNAQNRDFYFLDICATFLLTNCWRCVIMEILRASPVGAPPKKPPQKWGGFRISWAVLRPWTESFSEPCPRLTYTLRRVPGVRESLPTAVLPGRTLPQRCWG